MIILLIIILVFSPDCNIQAEKSDPFLEQILTGINKNITVMQLKKELDLIEKKIEMRNEYLPDFNILVQLNKNDNKENINLSYDHAFKFKNSFDVDINFKKSKQKKFNYLIEIKKQIYPLYNEKKITNKELILNKNKIKYEIMKEKFEELIKILSELNQYQYLKKKVTIENKKLNLEQNYYNKQTKINLLINKNELYEKKIFLKKLKIAVLEDQYTLNLLEKRRTIFSKINLGDSNLKFFNLNSIDRLQKEIVDKKGLTSYLDKLYQDKTTINSLKIKNINNTFLPQFTIKVFYDSIYDEKMFTANISFPLKNSRNKIELKKLKDSQKVLDSETQRNIKNNKLDIKELKSEIRLLKSEIDLLESKISIHRQKNSIVEKKVKAKVLENFRLKISRLNLDELKNNLTKVKNNLYILRSKLFFKETLN